MLYTGAFVIAHASVMDSYCAAKPWSESCDMIGLSPEFPHGKDGPSRRGAGTHNSASDHFHSHSDFST
jgi:hypothetical protein